MRRPVTAIIAGGFLLFGVSTLGGCGQIGPLYLPENEVVSEPEVEGENVPVPSPGQEQTKPAQPAQANQPTD